MSIRAVGSLGLSFLAGVFVSAFVSMVVNTAGTVVHRQWLGLIIVAVTICTFYPIHHLMWKRTSPAVAIHSQPGEGRASHPKTGSEG
jgi:hypothetical protein